MKTNSQRGMRFSIFIVAFGLWALSISGASSCTQDNGIANFQLPDLTGKTRRLSEFRGKPVVLNFWAFWCDTWREEMPHLRELTARQDEMGFRIMAISVDGTRVEEFKKREPKGAPFLVLLDSSKRVSQRYQIDHVPTVVILDSDGRERFRHVGFPGNHVVLRDLRKLD